jgi:hypothetical protein
VIAQLEELDAHAGWKVRPRLLFEPPPRHPADAVQHGRAVLQLKLELEKGAGFERFLRLDEDSTARHIGSELLDEVVDGRALVLDLERSGRPPVLAHLGHASPKSTMRICPHERTSSSHYTRSPKQDRSR